MWKKVNLKLFRDTVPGFCLEGRRKITINLTEDSQCTSQDLKLELRNKKQKC
jgi:hypothetical protein